MTTYNESLFVDYVLSSICDFVDEIIITDTAIKDVVDWGGSPHSTDGTIEIIKLWQKKCEKIHLLLPEVKPKTFAELCMPGLEMAKKLKGDWLMTSCGDEVWPTNVISPLRNFLHNCDNNGILGVNFTMNYFAPDFWHCKDFYGPRLSKITDDACMPFVTGDVLSWPRLGVWQSMELDKVPERVRKVNIDYPKFLKIFHYSCVGHDRVKFKYEFYKKHKDNIGSDHNVRYINKDWKFFADSGYREFAGNHPKIMLEHKLYNERLF